MDDDVEMGEALVFFFMRPKLIHFPKMVKRLAIYVMNWNKYIQTNNFVL